MVELEDPDNKTSLLAIVVSALMIVAAAPAALGGGPDADPAAPTEPWTVEDRVIVGFDGAMPSDTSLVANELGGEVAIADQATDWVALEFDSAAEADRAIERALEMDGVAYAEHDGYASLLQTPEVPPQPGRPVAVPGNPVTSPDDPDYDDQWGYPAIHTPEAWQITEGSQDVKVAVLDTGLDTDHPDIEANACGPFETFVSHEPTIEDHHGHGTHTSGTVAATSNNGVGVSGTSQSCLMHGKVLSGGGWGLWSWVAAGITWAADNGADVISMSLGGGGAPQNVGAAVDYAYNEQDVLVVSAAGNSGWLGCPSVGYPAAFPASMAVAAVEEPGHIRAFFSSCGDPVDIAAPGVNVLSTYKNGGYRSWAGTSMATPHVAGVAALVKAQWADIGATELRCLLYATSDDIGDPGRDIYTGFGRVNAFRALTYDPISIDNPATPAANAQALQEACGTTPPTPVSPPAP